MFLNLGRTRGRQHDEGLGFRGYRVGINPSLLVWGAFGAWARQLTG